jgi:general secretion pathway protein I
MMRSRFKNRTSRGFTLLEVMLAFVILASAMGLLIAMLSKGLGQVQQAQGETEATMYAQSLLDQIGMLEPIAPGRREGDFDHGRYHYQLEITETEDPAPPPPPATGNGPAPSAIVEGGAKLYRIALAVHWGDNRPAQQLKFVTLRARTPQADQPGQPDPAGAQ